MRIALSTLGIERLDPALGSSATAGIQIAPYVDTLFWLDRGEAAKPNIVEKWDMATDGLSWTFYIRKGIKFHNGEDLKADDVKFSMERQMRPDAYFVELKTGVDRIELVDEFTLRVYTKGKQPFLQYPLTQGRAEGVVLPKDYIDKNGLPYFERYPVGSGSFRFVRNVPGDFIEYEAVDKHWKRTAGFEKLVMVLMPDEVTRVASLKTGAANVIDIGLEAGADLERAGYTALASELVTPVVQCFGALDSRVAGKPIADVRVRQALSLAIDRDAMLKNFFLGKGTLPLPLNLHEGTTDIDVPYWKEYAAKAFRYDPEEAKRLLKEAGYPDGFTTKLYSYPAAGAPWLPKMAEIIESSWRKIGVKAEITPIEFGNYTSWRRGPADPFLGQISLFRFNSSTNVLGPRALKSYHSVQASATLIAPKAIPDLDKQIEDMQVEMDDTKRREMVAKIIKIAADTWTDVPIAIVPAMFALGPGVGFDFSTPTPSPYPVTYSAWFIHRK